MNSKMKVTKVQSLWAMVAAFSLALAGMVVVGGEANASALYARPASLSAAADIPAEEPVIKPVTVYKVVQSSKAYYTEYGQVIGRCNAQRDNVTCTIQQTVTASRTVQVIAGVNRNTVSGSLGISTSTSLSYSVSCTSPKMRKGQSFSAYPAGNRYQYKISQQNWMDKQPKISGWLYAFNPLGHITCK